MKKLLRWQGALCAYLAGLGIIGFWPAPVDKPIQGALAALLNQLHGHGAPGWLDYFFVEASANVGMFIPFGIVIAMALPDKAWWQLIGVGLICSACMELGQLMFIMARFASPMDLVTNTSGAVIGIAAARFASHRSQIPTGVSN